MADTDILVADNCRMGGGYTRNGSTAKEGGGLLPEQGTKVEQIKEGRMKKASSEK